MAATERTKMARKVVGLDFFKMSLSHYGSLISNISTINLNRHYIKNCAFIYYKDEAVDI